MGPLDPAGNVFGWIADLCAQSARPDNATVIDRVHFSPTL
jgi:hypothetical protein